MADPNAFICRHCDELSGPAEPCPGRDDPGGPCERPRSPDYREGLHHGLVVALLIVETLRAGATDSRGRALSAVAEKLRSEALQARDASAAAQLEVT